MDGRPVVHAEIVRDDKIWFITYRVGTVVGLSTNKPAWRDQGAGLSTVICSVSVFNFLQSFFPFAVLINQDVRAN